jgi:hypothetical protein
MPVGGQSLGNGLKILVSAVQSRPGPSSCSRLPAKT